MIKTIRKKAKMEDEEDIQNIVDLIAKHQTEVCIFPHSLKLELTHLRAFFSKNTTILPLRSTRVTMRTYFSTMKPLK